MVSSWHIEGFREYFCKSLTFLTLISPYFADQPNFSRSSVDILGRTLSSSQQTKIITPHWPIVMLCNMAARPVQALRGQWTWCSFHMALRSWPPTFVGHIHPHLPSQDRSPLSRALNPPQSAPLHHINSGTGTNCPTLDVLETQIATAASVLQLPPNTPPQTEETPQKRNCKIAGFHAWSFGKPLVIKRLHLLHCVTVYEHPFKIVFQTSPPILVPHTRFVLSRRSAALRFHFYFRKNTNKYSLCTLRFGETFPRIPSTSIL